MTIAIALRVADGVVVASDSMASDVSIATVQRKITTCSGLSLAFAFAGSVHLGQAVERAIRGLDETTLARLSTLDSFALMDDLVGRVRDVVRTALDGLLPDPDDTSRYAEFLFAGVATDGPFIAVVKQDLSYVLEDQHTFAAIGIGRVFANAAMRVLSHYLHDRSTVREAVPLAVRIVDAVCQVSAYGIGAPVHLAVVEPAACRMFDAAEVESAMEQVESWLRLENATLYPTGDGPVALPRYEDGKSA